MASKSLKSAHLTINMDLSVEEVASSEPENASRSSRKWPNHLKQKGKINRPKFGRLVGRKWISPLQNSTNYAQMAAAADLIDVAE